jgi:cellulose biosynthesis protein BcsQ
MTIVFSIQRSRGGSGTTSIALTLAYNLSMHGRTLYIEADFLNPIIEKLMPSRIIAPRWSNEWITGEASLDESCRDVSGIFNLAPNRLYFMLANPSDGARRRIEALDAEGDRKILKALEKQDWVLNKKPLDYVVIDTPPWMYYILACISYISNYIIYVVRPNMYELSILEDRIENIYSNFVCLLNPAINMYDSRNESMKKFEEKLRERIDVKPVKIPYIPELASGIDLPMILSRENKMLSYLVEAVEEIMKKPKISEASPAGGGGAAIIS